LHRSNLILRGLSYHWRAHLGVILGATASTAVLAGALLVGDSVEFTLRELSARRLGKVELALYSPFRFFRSALANDIAASLNATVAPVLELSGSIAAGDNSAQASHVHVLGVDQRFWTFGESPAPRTDTEEGILINRRLADHLGVGVGGEVVLRVEKPSDLPLDAPLSTEEDSTLAFRTVVQAIASDECMGPFSLQASQIPPYNAFLPIAWLEDKLKLAGKANLLVASSSGSSILSSERANRILQEKWQLADAGLELRDLPAQGDLELRTSRIFLDPPAAEAALKAGSSPSRILTYFVNELRHEDRAVPYSIATAMERLPNKAVVDSSSSENSLADGEIILNEWTASDLEAKPGDTIDLAYFILGPLRKLEEQHRTFTVKEVVPMAEPWTDQALMPDFPGMSDRKNCRDWEPGFDIDLSKIRDKDEGYWQQYKGTPKAFVTLKAGQEIWINRFGDLTAIRFPLGSNAHPSVEKAILAGLDPKLLGLSFQATHPKGGSSPGQAVDFGGLFLVFSFFLIVAALLLVGMLYVFGIETRCQETGTLLAIGYSPKLVRRLFMAEGLVLGCIGGLSGLLLAIVYTRLVLYGLSTVWRGAVGGGIPLFFHAKTSTLIAGGLLGIVMAAIAIWMTVRRQASRPARELLSGGSEWMPERALSKVGRRNWSGWVALVCLLTAGGLMVFANTSDTAKAEAAFFGVGSLLLLAGLSFLYAALSRVHGHRKGAVMSVTVLGIGNAGRRRGRSVTTMALLACGSFLVIAVGANRQDASHGAERRSSGTGGFALFAEATFPVLHDLNTEAGCNAYGLSRKDLEGVDVAPLRVHKGEDASCLNLNRATTPTLLGIQPGLLESRGAFTLATLWQGSSKDKGWKLLEGEEADGTIPGIADASTITWALGISVGDVVPYTDERGHTFRVRIVGALENSLFQGNILISEDHFVSRYPSESGYRMLLVDAPSAHSKEAASILSRALSDLGLDVSPAPERLAAFNAVENTYLSIFQALGGLGLILGSFGLGVVVLRNVLERRGELALLRAVGFSRRSLEWLVLSEHWMLLLGGLACGAASGLAAVIPNLRSSGADFPLVSLSWTLFGILASGVLWTWLAARLALRGPLLDALRNE
jgi:ABC-type antimicrobial peptide transport system permease subunit